MNIIICKRTPALIKSKNLYPPAVITNAFVGDATGVVKAILEETAMAIKNVYGFASKLMAAVIAIGANKTAVAVTDTSHTCIVYTFG